VAKRASIETHETKSAGFAEVEAVNLNRPQAIAVIRPYLSCPSTTQELIPPKPNELLMT
jgi:hypothetical protein